MNYRDYISSSFRSCAVVVHRGLWSAAPENSLLAIDHAIAAGHPVVEIDVRRTADGGFVLLHDDTLERMAGLNRAPEEMTLAELGAVRLRNRDGGPANRMTEERLPTLEEVFELTRGRIYIHLDVKRREVIPEVLARCRSMGIVEQVDFWADLRTPDDLAWARREIVLPEVLFMPKIRLNAGNADEQLRMAFDLKPAVCELVYGALDEIRAVQDRFDDAGIALWCNTLDDVACAGFTDTAALDRPGAIWGRLIDAGVSVIQTDNAGELEVFLRGRVAA